MIAGIERLGAAIDLEQAGVIPAAGTAVCSTSDADDEVRVVVRGIVYSGLPQWKALLLRFAERMPTRKRMIQKYLNGELPTENIAHLLEAFAQEGRLNLHIRVLSGENDHHIAEAVFKGLARCLRTAVAIDPRASGAIPSTKDVL